MSHLCSPIARETIPNGIAVAIVVSQPERSQSPKRLTSAMMVHYNGLKLH